MSLILEGSERALASRAGSAGFRAGTRIGLGNQGRYLARIVARLGQRVNPDFRIY